MKEWMNRQGSIPGRAKRFFSATEHLNRPCVWRYVSCKHCGLPFTVLYPLWPNRRPTF
jgi:hypothetical protein